ncbi:MAG: hypothetical protein QXO27_03450 [Candidatus Aenigmatarchaeota archaeon]
MVLGLLSSIVIEGGITIVLFLILFNFASKIMTGAFERTDAMVNNFEDSTKLSGEISKTDSYMKDLLSMSVSKLGKLLNAVDVSKLSEQDRQYLQENKDFLESIKINDTNTNPDLKDIENSIDKIIEILENSSYNCFSPYQYPIS